MKKFKTDYDIVLHSIKSMKKFNVVVTKEDVEKLIDKYNLTQEEREKLFKHI